MDLYAEKVKNWGKGGPDDELGTVNYITPHDIIRAARLMKKRKVFSLSIRLGSEGPQNEVKWANVMKNLPEEYIREATAKSWPGAGIVKAAIKLNEAEGVKYPRQRVK